MKRNNKKYKTYLDRDIIIDVEDLRSNSLQWLETGETEFHGLSREARRKEMIRYNEQVTKYDADMKWALYCYPNKTEYLQQVIKYLELKPDDVLLDIGAGDGRLSIMAIQQFNIKEAIAIEWCDKWVKATNDYIGDKWPENMTYEQNTYQDYDFPERVTKCVFLAHHNGNLTRTNILTKLSRTKCRLFVHNFGMQGKVAGERLGHDR